MRTTAVRAGVGVVVASVIGGVAAASAVGAAQRPAATIASTARSVSGDAGAPNLKAALPVRSASELLTPDELDRQQQQAPLMAIANEVSVLVQPYAAQQLGGLSLTPTSVRVAWKGAVPAVLVQAQARHGGALQIVSAKFSQADLVAASQRIGSAGPTPVNVALSSDGTGLTIEAPASAHAALTSAIAAERATGMVVELTTPAPNLSPALD